MVALSDPKTPKELIPYYQAKHNTAINFLDWLNVVAEQAFLFYYPPKTMDEQLNQQANGTGENSTDREAQYKALQS